MIRFIKSDTTGPINIGNPSEFMSLPLTELIRFRIQPNLPLISKPLPQDYLYNHQPINQLSSKRTSLGSRVLQGGRPTKHGKRFEEKFENESNIYA